MAKPFTNKVEKGWKKCTGPIVGGARSITFQIIISLFAGQTLYQAALLETYTSLLHRFTAEYSRDLMSSEEYRSSLRKLNNKQRRVVMFLLFLLFKLSSQLPFVSFSFLSISILSLLPFPISPSLSTISSFSSDQFSVLLRLQVSFSLFT